MGDLARQLELQSRDNMIGAFQNELLEIKEGKHPVHVPPGVRKLFKEHGILLTIIDGTKQRHVLTEFGEELLEASFNADPDEPYLLSSYTARAVYVCARVPNIYGVSPTVFLNLEKGF